MRSRRRSRDTESSGDATPLPSERDQNFLDRRTRDAGSSCSRSRIAMIPRSCSTSSTKGCGEWRPGVAASKCRGFVPSLAGADVEVPREPRGEPSTGCACSAGSTAACSPRRRRAAVALLESIGESSMARVDLALARNLRAPRHAPGAAVGSAPCRNRPRYMRRCCPKRGASRVLDGLRCAGMSARVDEPAPGRHSRRCQRSQRAGRNGIA